MMMDRRTFSGAMAVGAAASLISTRGMAATPAPMKARNVVLVHGLFADGSCWSEAIARSQAAGLNATAVQNPLTTLTDAVAAAQRVSESEGSLHGAGAGPKGSAHRQGHAGGLAVEAELLCRFHGGPDDQSRSRTLHGQAHGWCPDHRSQGKPSLADLPSRRSHEADPGSSGPARLADGATSPPPLPPRHQRHL